MPWHKDNWKAENRKLDKNGTLCKKLHASYLVHILNQGQPRTHSNLILFMSHYKKQGVVQQSISWHEIHYVVTLFPPPTWPGYEANAESDSHCAASQSRQYDKEVD